MGKEIERKFLVKDKSYRKNTKGILFKQGYLSTDLNRIVRVRIQDSKGFITIKGKNLGAVRSDFEYEIPLQDAEEMLDILCEKPIIEKYRYRIEHAGFVWEVDEFLGENEGLVVAEIELSDENAFFSRPEWLGQEVTDDPTYFNSNLVKVPFKRW